MEHILFLFYSFSFLIYVASMVFIIGIYLREKSTLLKLYLFFRGVMGFLFLLVIFLIYYFVNFSQWIMSPKLHIIISALPVSVLTIFIQLLYNYIFYPERKNRIRIFLLTFISVVFIYYTLIFSVSVSFKSKIVINLISGFTIHAFNLAFLLKCVFNLKSLLKKIESDNFKMIIKYGLSVFISLIVTLLIVIGVKINSPFEKNIIHAFIYPLPMILWDVVAIYFSLKYYRDKESLDGVSDTFIRKYYITDREREVILLLIEGKSNKEIAEHLSISVNTVKTNVYNIFQKTGVKSRFSLISMSK